MASRITYPGNGTLYVIPFDYLDRTHVKVAVDGEELPSDQWSFATAGTVSLDADPGAATVTIYRETPTEPLTVYQSGSVLSRNDLEVDSLQALYRIEEVNDSFPGFPEASPLAPLIWDADGVNLENGSTELTGDMLLRGNLAADSGASLVGFLQTGTGAISSTLQADLRLVGLFPEQFGAVGDGVTGDDAALNAMYVEAEASGRPVFLGPKTYLVQSTVALRSGTRTYGVPGRTTIKAGDANTASVLTFSATGRTNVYVEGVVFDGNYDNLAAGTLLQVYNSQDVVFNNCRFQNARRLGVLFSTNIMRSGVMNSQFLNIGNYYRVTLDDADKLSALTFTESVLGNSEGNFSINNYFYDTGLDDISFGWQKHVKAHGNRSVRPFPGSGRLCAFIYVNDCDHLSIIGNSSRGTWGQSIDTLQAKNLVAVGNFAEDCAGGGILLANTDTALVSGNIFRRTNYSTASSHRGAITLRAGVSQTKNVTITGNVLVDGHRWGIYGESDTFGYANVSIDHTNVIANMTDGKVGGVGPMWLGGGDSSATLYVRPDTTPLDLMPAASYAEIRVLNVTEGYYGVFVINNGTLQEVLDPSAQFEPSDTGLRSAVYVATVGGVDMVRLKNRTGASKTYAVKIIALGQPIS